MSLIKSRELNEKRVELRKNGGIIAMEALRFLSNSPKCGAMPLTDAECIERIKAAPLLGSGSTKEAHDIGGGLVGLINHSVTRYGNQCYRQSERWSAAVEVNSPEARECLLPVYRIGIPQGGGSVDTEYRVLHTFIIVPKAERYDGRDASAVKAYLEHFGYYDFCPDNIGIWRERVVAIDYGANFHRALDAKAEVIIERRDYR